MPNLKVIQSSIAELTRGPPLVAALAGGTTGIGSYVAKSLATTFAKQGSKLRVYIVGRNADRAKAVIQQCQNISPDSEWRFVRATDLALISEVDRCCAEISRQETEAPFHGGPVRLDLLYMSHCYPILAQPTTTKEGLDAFLSTVYYSRIRFVMKLMPLLTASSIQGHVVSIYAGSFDESKPGEKLIGMPPAKEYGVTGVRKYTCFMKTLMFERFAEEHAGHLSLSHIYPGLVDGPGFSSPELPAWFRNVWKIMKPLASFYMTKADVCGDVMVYLATSRYPAKGTSKERVGGIEVAKSTTGEVGGGSYSVGQRADVAKKTLFEKTRNEGAGKEVWDHTMQTFERIEKEGA